MKLSLGKDNPHEAPEEHFICPAPQETKPDRKRRTVIHGLNDSHMHPIRGGLNYNMGLRWDGVRSLADAPRMPKEQAAWTPAPQWVRVVGCWKEIYPDSKND
jgi:predicted amidohydrolase YtcJ